MAWTTEKADARFSEYIRTRDKKCRRCKRNESTDNSHFWGRGNSATRYDPENCVGACRECHGIWENQKKGAYKDWMLTWLGEERYKALEKRARSIMKREKAIANLVELLETEKHITFG